MSKPNPNPQLNICEGRHNRFRLHYGRVFIASFNCQEGGKEWYRDDDGDDDLGGYETPRQITLNGVEQYRHISKTWTLEVDQDFLAFLNDRIADGSIAALFNVEYENQIAQLNSEIARLRYSTIEKEIGRKYNEIGAIRVKMVK